MSVQMLSCAQYAKLMGMHPAAVRRMCEQGRVSCAKVGGRWRIAHEAPGCADQTRKAPDDDTLGELLEAIQAAAEGLAAAADALSGMAGGAQLHAKGD